MNMVVMIVCKVEVVSKVGIIIKKEIMNRTVKQIHALNYDQMRNYKFYLMEILDILAGDNDNHVIKLNSQQFCNSS
jgi:hypothetical protein